jgi:hypothetical protein
MALFVLARFNGLIVKWLKPAKGKDVKTPFDVTSGRNHAVNGVAMCPAGQRRKPKSRLRSDKLVLLCPESNKMI